MEKSNNMLVSVCCITYNHAPFIRQCLDGLVMQKTNFKYEIIIHDDCSTDGTTDIVKEYASKYPDLIVPIIQRENQYQNGVRRILATFMLPIAKGKYIALCEGDDYWIDPLKLQKQVDYLDLNPEVGLCFTDFNIKFQKSGRYYTSVLKKYPKKFQSEFKCIDEWLLGNFYLGPMTWMGRTSLWKNVPDVNSIDGTFVQFAYFFVSSKVCCMKNETTAVYRCVDNSATHQLSVKKQYERENGMFQARLFMIDQYRENMKDYERTLYEIKKNYYSTLLLILDNGDEQEINIARMFLKGNMSFKQKLIFMIYKIPHGLYFLMLIRKYYRILTKNKKLY